MFDDLLEANSRYASRFDLGGLEARAARGFCLVTCMDTRIDPMRVLGLEPGDAKYLRNAGGRVTGDVLRSLVLATNYLGVTRIAVMHHTRCALAGNSDPELSGGLPEPQRLATAGWAFLGMPDPDAALAADVDTVRSCKGLADGVIVEGWRYDVDTGVVDRRITA